MILRSLRFVGFRGLPETRWSDLLDRGVTRVVLPSGADPATISQVLRFLIAGGGPDVVDASSEGPRLAFVEATLRGIGGEEVSLFRGVDARGNVQASLREADGRRVTDGEEAVARRLTELIGTTPTEWCAAALDAHLRTDVPAATRGGSPTTSGRAAASERPELAPMAAAARNATRELRRSLRSERLRLLAARRFGELVEHARRLRHERRRAALAADRESVERDRARARLRGVTEYRDRLERGVEAERPAAAGSPVPSARPSVTRATSFPELVLIGCATLTFAALVLYSTAATADPDRRLLQVGLGLAFVVSVASYLHVATREQISSDEGPRASDEAADARARRDALRQRFADLGDPDDPGLTERLRARLAELDARLAPLQGRLEALDDAIAVCDVEIGRAARALHETTPELGPGDEGLSEGTTVPQAVARVHTLGDAVYAAVIERDALLSAGTAEPSESRQALAVALDALADACEAPVDVPALLRRVDAFACSVTEEPEEDEVAAALTEAIGRMERSEPVLQRRAEEPPDVPRRGLVVPDRSAARRSDEELAAAFGDERQVLIGEQPPAGADAVRVRRPGLSRRPE